ncbi:MAG: ATP-binding cassette domain-containing protein [Clostridia bacterium]|nr:ATP-binding cassette domain-containing protein [Clostridia bacterium]
MLEVRNLKKIYKTKNGSNVNALDGVSLSFPETGMVFLLGKSGSGKSTLLNICGGLDTPTEGEIIVKGRSSKDFTQSDFDSYRNTFIGFIFQEYNILNEFSVEDNIALALELQGKPKDKVAIAQLLEDVDLTGFAKRKPNTLSGGQKQRIAIARALLKKPEIIMADEPTGALDSNTGKQVFDTLKKLSRDKLVIVVSHDRDFAEQYGDRIIELKDGKVLSDVSKTYATGEEISSNVSLVGNVICIKKGTDLTESDFNSIKRFLKDTDNDIIIAGDKKSVKDLKTAARITDSDKMEVFNNTDTEKIHKKQYTKEDSCFIRSKLPMHHAFKIGVSGLRNKPIRLFFTVLLCSVAFIFFSLLSTLNFYNSEATFKQTLRDSEIAALQLSKEYKIDVTWYMNGEKDHVYEEMRSAAISPEEFKKFSSEINADAFGGVQCMESFNLRQVETKYWHNNITAFAVLPEGNTLRGQINGQYPKNENEIVISSYFAGMLMECNVYGDKGATITLSKPEDIIGKTIVLSGHNYKVTGILDSGAVPEKYESLKEGADDDDWAIIEDLYKHLESGLHLLVFVSPQRAVDIADSNIDYMDSKENYMRIASAIKLNGEFNIDEYADSTYSAVSKLSANEKLYAVSKQGTDLKSNEIILPSHRFARFVAEAYSELGNRASESENYTLAEKYNELSMNANEIEMGGVYELTDNKNDNGFKPFTDAEFASKLNALIAAVKRDNIDLTVGLQLYDDYNQNYIGEVKSYNVVSVYKSNQNDYDARFYLADQVAEGLWDTQKVAVPSYPETKTNYVAGEDDVYSVVYMPGNVSDEKIDAYWNIYNNEEFSKDSSRIVLSGGFVDSLKMVDYMVKDLSKVFLYAGLILAVFAALLLSNFISASISNKKREIGILRAVGARSNDVFKIFFSESFVIGSICVVLSTVTSIILCNILNKEFASDLGASIFVFGIGSFAVLVAIAVITILIATILPVYNAARKKPVDSIRSL